MGGRDVLSCVIITLLVITTVDIAEACKKCGQDVCSCNSHHGHGNHHGSLALAGHHHTHSGLYHSGGYGYSCGHHLGQHGGHHGGFHGSLHGDHHGCGGIHMGGGCGLHVGGGTYGIGGGLHVGHIGGGYGLGGGNYLITAPPICNVCGGYAYNGSFLRRRHWRPRCRCY